MSELQTEHYKALREEYRHYLAHVQQLWNFKLSAIGAIVLACVFNDKIQQLAGKNTELIIAVGFCVLPLLALLIDLKALETGLHVKLISDHLKKYYSHEPAMADWENNVWNKTPLSRWRTRLTVFTATGTSAVILFVSAIIVCMLQPGWQHIVITAASLLFLVLLLVLMRIRKFIFATETTAPVITQQPAAEEPPAAQQ